MMTTDPDVFALTDRQRRLIRHSFTRITRRYNVIVSLMFDRLFTLNPALRPLFPEARHDLNRKLVEFLALIVQRLDAPDELYELVQKASRRTGAAVMVRRDEAAFAGAFLWALRYGLATGYSDEVESAWTQLAAHVLEVAAQADLQE